MTYIMTLFRIFVDQDDGCDYMTINLVQGHGKNCELYHLQDVDRVRVLIGMMVMIMMIKMMILVMVILT